MSITNNDGNSNNNENSKKSKENLRELSYLIEEERLLADLKRKSEETLEKLRVEEITLLRFVKGLANSSGGMDKPINLAPVSNCNITNAVNLNNNQTPNVNTVATTSTIESTVPINSTTNNQTISSIEQNVNNTEVLKLNVDNILLSMNNNEEMDEDDIH